jgi:ribonuclease HI
MNSSQAGPFILQADGASKGNPGPAGAGAVLFDPDGRPVFRLGKYLGRMTNNMAEYHGLIEGLKVAKGLGLPSLRVRMDSQLAVRQIDGQYRVKNPGLLPLWQEAKSLLSSFSPWSIEHVYREGNSLADKLASSAAVAGAEGRISPGDFLPGAGPGDGGDLKGDPGRPQAL